MKKQSDTFGTQPSANRNIEKIAPSGSPVTTVEEDADPVKAFLAKHPLPSNDASPEDDLVGSLSPPELPDAPAVAVPAAAAPSVDSQGEPVAAKTDEVPAAVDKALAEAGAGAPKPGEAAPAAKTEEKPAEAPAAAAPAKPAVEPAKPSYAADEKIPLVEGQPEWTRAQVVAALNDRVQLQPKAAEADEFRAIFGYDAKKAKEEWSPILARLQAAPERADLLTEVLNTDAATFEYLQQSAAFFNSPEGLAARGLTERPASALPAKAGINAPTKTDPEIERVKKLGDRMYNQLRDQKTKNEMSQAIQRYPFLRTAPKQVWDGLAKTADALADRAKANGVDELEFNGLLKALDENSYVYDQMQTVFAATQIVKPVEPVVEQPPSIDPTKGAEALLGSTGAAPSGPSRAQREKDFTGNSDDAVSAFLKDHPGR